MIGVVPAVDVPVMVWFNGAGYVVRRDRRLVLVGIRQGMAAPSGFAVRWYGR